MKTLNFKHYGHLPILIKNTPRSKALEPVCLFRPPLPPIVTQSPRGEGGERVRLLPSAQIDDIFVEGRSSILQVYKR
jgi:hypothetical protein